VRPATTRCTRISGSTAETDAARDRRRIYAAAFVRAVATGTIAVVLGLYLARLGLGAADVGFVVGAGLAGGAAGVGIASVAADRVGHVRFLRAFALVSGAGGLVLALASEPPVLALAAFVGMVNGMGRDRSAALVVEQALLPSTTTDAGRTGVLAWYHLLQDAGHALGGLAAAVPGLLAGGAAGAGTLRLTVGAYALVVLATAALYRGVSAPAPLAGRPRLSPESRRVVGRLAALFAVDSVAGGFLTTALLALFFQQRFGAGVATLGLLFSGARVANAVSHLVAAWIARRIGLLNTMVWTHVPSSLLLATVPFAPTFGVAAALFLLREGLVEMDVPTRQSYVLAVVRPEERAAAAGITHLVRMAGWAVAPFLAGPLMESVAPATPLYVGAAMKIAYDGLLYVGFRRTVPPEERAAA
jgi:MFS family permease